MDDRRRLGVAISEIHCVTVTGPLRLTLDSACFGNGWYGEEAAADAGAFRWTDGAASLTVPDDTIRIGLTVMATAQYPEGGEDKGSRVND